MTRRDRASAYVFARSRALPLAISLASLLPACSALVSPDIDRLGGTDGGSSLGPDAPGGCGAGEIACGTRCVDPSTDRTACGGCGIACNAGIACISGRCACPASDPACMTTTTPIGDATSCGPSRLRCTTGQLCVLGACVCRPPLTLVGDRCVDLNSDPNHCGAPDVRCPDTCRAGMCATACGGGLNECDGACVNLDRDPLNCGECGRACSGNAVCIDRNCRDILPARGCTSCPCSACEAACCTLPRLDVPYCVGADACP